MSAAGKGGLRTSKADSSMQLPKAEELEFTSADVSRIAGVSLRQLQWWDERNVVSPREKGSRRVYRFPALLEAMIVAALRRKGLSLQKVRRVMRALRRLSDHRLAQSGTGASPLYLLTDGGGVYLEDNPKAVLSRLTEARNPMYLVSLDDQIARIRRFAGEKRPRRVPQQFELFEPG